MCWFPFQVGSEGGSALREAVGLAAVGGSSRQAQADTSLVQTVYVMLT